MREADDLNHAIAFDKPNRFSKRNVSGQQHYAKVCGHKRHRILLGASKMCQKFRVTRKTVTA